MGKKKKARLSSEDDTSDPVQGSEADEASSIIKENSLYEILGVERAASQQELKKAYYKLALRLHPDKNPGDDEAKEKFQLLQKVMSILGDEEKRAIYDQTGLIDDDMLVGNAADDLQEYFRSMYKKVTEADIEEFEASYRGSDSEKKDLKDLYLKYNGNMGRLFCSMICSYPELDSHRFKDIIDDAIKEGELKSSRTYQKWAKKISSMKPPTDPLVRKPKSSKEKAETDLVALISQRRSDRREQFNSFLSSVMAKHGSAESSEPSEADFQAARQRLEVKNRSKGGKKK